MFGRKTWGKRRKSAKRDRRMKFHGRQEASGTGLKKSVFISFGKNVYTKPILQFSIQFLLLTFHLNENLKGAIHFASFLYMKRGS